MSSIILVPFILYNNVNLRHMLSPCRTGRRLQGLARWLCSWGVPCVSGWESLPRCDHFLWWLLPLWVWEEIRGRLLQDSIEQGWGERRRFWSVAGLKYCIISTSDTWGHSSFPIIDMNFHYLSSHSFSCGERVRINISYVSGSMKAPRVFLESCLQHEVTVLIQYYCVHRGIIREYFNSQVLVTV